MNRSSICRPATLCVAFLAVAALVVGGLGWVTVAALGVEASDLQATARADRANKERIALWRLDGQLLPTLGLENNRPYSHYTALSDPLPAVAADRGEVLTPGEVRLPSPLLGADLPGWMTLHFQLDPDAGWSSPQVLAPALAAKLRSPGFDLALTNVTPERAARLGELKARFPVADVAEVLADLDPIDPADPTPVVVPATEFLSQNTTDPSNALTRNNPLAPTQPGGFGGGGGSGANAMQARGGFGGGLAPAQRSAPPPAGQMPQSNDPEFMSRLQTMQKSMPAPGYDNTAGLRNVVPPPSPTPAPAAMAATLPATGASAGTTGKPGGGQEAEAVPPAGRGTPPAPKAIGRPAAPTPVPKDAPAAPAGGMPGGGPARGLGDPDDARKQAEAKKLKEAADLHADRLSGPKQDVLPDAARAVRFGATSPGPGHQAAAGAAVALDLALRAKQTREQLPVTPPVPLGRSDWEPEKKEADKPAAARRVIAKPVAAHLGPLRPLWLTAADGSDALVLVRAARLETGKVVYQGVLLDWPALQRELCAQVADLFPDAALAPVHVPAPATPERTMTAIPARLDPGPEPPAPAAGWSSLRLGLGLAWLAAVLGLTAVGVGGRTLVDLSERRIRFVSAVTHELRTPLTSLRLYLDLLTSGLVTDPDKQREYLGTLSNESDRLNRLIENVLDFARLEKRTVKAAAHPTPVGELLDQVQTTWADRLAADGKELVVHSTLPPGQAVRTDPRMAAQVVGNLIDNARKYSREAADPRVWVWAKPGSRGRVLIEVEDRGPGVPAADRRGIFRPFRRGQDADTTAGGAGLGLALAKQWADLLGGDLSYRPADGGVGACFRLELPAVLTNLPSPARGEGGFVFLARAGRVSLYVSPSLARQAGDWRSSTYATASAKYASSLIHFVLPPSVHHFRFRPSASDSVRDPHALNCSITSSGGRLAATTTCTWFVRTLTACNFQPRTSQCRRIVASTMARWSGVSVTGSSARAPAANS
ncbi:MAG: HAMP domain-containing sensor histidine kinase [Gemmataceae bacterium]